MDVRTSRSRLEVDGVAPVRVCKRLCELISRHISMYTNFLAGDAVCRGAMTNGGGQVYSRDAAEGRFVDRVKDNLNIKIIKLSDEEVVFDLVGVEAPIANALRRIMLSEVPSMAFETVFIHQNSSIVQDEVLAHRLGLIPVDADPDMFEYCNGAGTDLLSLVFREHAPVST